jgi:hypothetical protein
MGSSSSEFLELVKMIRGATIPIDEEPAKREVVSEEKEPERADILRKTAERRGYEMRYLSSGRCGKCGELMVSTHRHDFVGCPCGGAYVDGGWDYGKYGGAVHPAFVEGYFDPKGGRLVFMIEPYTEKDNAIKFEGFPALDSQKKENADEGA